MADILQREGSLFRLKKGAISITENGRESTFPGFDQRITDITSVGI